MEEVRRRIKQQEQEYLKKRRKEKEESHKEKLDNKVLTNEKKPGFVGRWYTDINNTVYVQGTGFSDTTNPSKTAYHLL